MFNKFKTGKVSADIDQEAELLTEVAEYTSEPNPKVLPEKIVNAAQKPSIISEGASFEGSLVLDGALHLDGKFKGTIKVDKVTIGKNGELDGISKANTIVVFGEIKGEISCRELTLHAGSSIDGNIEYSSIKIFAGASIAGQINRKKQ